MVTRRMDVAHKLAETLRAIAETIETFAADPSQKLPRALLKMYCPSGRFVIGEIEDVEFLFNPTCPECGCGLDDSDICTSASCKTRE